MEPLPDLIRTSETLRPLRDQIVVKPLAWEPSKLLAVAHSKRTLRGVVVAAGPGHYPKRYNRDRSKTWDSHAFQPMSLRVGDVVELGGLEIDGYSFPTVLIGTERHVLCREADVCGVYTSFPS